MAKKFLCIIALILALCLAFVSCGDTNNDETSDKEEEQPIIREVTIIEWVTALDLSRLESFNFAFKETENQGSKFMTLEGTFEYKDGNLVGRYDGNNNGSTQTRNVNEQGYKIRNWGSIETAWLEKITDKLNRNDDFGYSLFTYLENEGTYMGILNVYGYDIVINIQFENGCIAKITTDITGSNGYSGSGNYEFSNITLKK